MNHNWFRAAAVCVAVAICLVQVSCAATKSTPQVKKEASKAVKRLPKLLDLGATTCTMCKMMMPVLDELKKDYKGQLEVEFINVREDKDAVKKYELKAIPTQIIFDSKGKQVWRHVGYVSKNDLLKAFKAEGIKLTKPAPPKNKAKDGKK